MRTSRSQVQVWISRRRADNNGLKYQNGGGIIKKKRKNVHKNSYTGPEFLRAHHVTDEPDSGKTAAVVDGAAEEMKRQRVRGRDTGTTYFPMKSVCDLSAEDDELHSLAAPASSMAPKSLSQNEHNGSTKKSSRTPGREDKKRRGPKPPEEFY